MPLTSDLQQSDPVRGQKHDSVPCVDLRRIRGNDTSVVATMRDACLNTGFFYLDNAFENQDTMPNVLGQMQSFFSLADEDPRKQAVNVAVTPSKWGWTPLYGELPYQPGTIAHVESFDCGRRPPEGGGDPPHIWPELANFRRDVRACWDSLANAGSAVLEGLALAAGLERRFFADRCDSQQFNTMRLLNYPENDKPPTDTNVGISAHTDFECMTLIYQSAPGLELMATDGDWYDVPGHDGRLIVMLDDMMERWTNGMFRATGHRVRNTGQQRFSIVMFFAVNDEEIITPLENFISECRPAKYDAVRQRDHLQHEMQKAAQNRDAFKKRRRIATHFPDAKSVK
jgi:isopenicillin N synthase-like dioxygenase